MKKTRIYFRMISLISIFLVVLVGCGGGSVGSNNQEISFAYIGPWKGLISGPGGQDKLNMTLYQEGVMQATGNKAYYKFTLGTWRISGTNFRGTASRGTFTITLNGSLLKDSIAGSWTGNDGSTGTFTVSRPPEIGTWTGTIDGSGGLANLTLNLNADGTISTQTDSSFYSPLSGTWDVTNSSFSATASGGGIVVKFTGAVQNDSMAGTWSGNNGTSGTFAATKK